MIAGIKPVYDSVGKAYDRNVYPCRTGDAGDCQENPPCGDNHIGTVGLQAVFLYSLLHGKGIQSVEYFLQCLYPHPVMTVVTTRHEPVVFIDVSARTYYLYTRIRPGKICHVLAETLPFGFCHGAVERSDRTDVI